MKSCTGRYYNQSLEIVALSRSERDGKQRRGKDLSAQRWLQVLQACIKSRFKCYRHSPTAIGSW